MGFKEPVPPSLLQAAKAILNGTSTQCRAKNCRINLDLFAGNFVETRKINSLDAHEKN